MVDWSKTTDKDIRKIVKILDRIWKMGQDYASKLTIMMDLQAAHAACPIDLQKLLEADDMNFLHDITGIARHIDRRSGELKDCFVPRYAL